MTHERAEKEMDEAIEAIVRRAMAELRALNRGCVCALLHATKVMQALAIDERVIGKEDAFVAIDLVEYRRWDLNLRPWDYDSPRHGDVKPLFPPGKNTARASRKVAAAPPVPHEKKGGRR